MNAPPPLPPRPSSSGPTPATPPPAPAPSAPIRDFDALYRELVAVLSPVSIPATPATPVSAPPADSALAASLLPINQKQLEILQRAENERANRSTNDARDRDWRRTIHLSVAGLVLLLEIASQVLRVFLATHYPEPSPAPATTVYVSPPPASSATPPGAR